jgi:hypothetical protein
VDCRLWGFDGTAVAAWVMLAGEVGGKSAIAVEILSVPLPSGR